MCSPTSPQLRPVVCIPEYSSGPQPTATLEDVLITRELYNHWPKQLDVEAKRSELQNLADHRNDGVLEVMQRLVDACLRMCKADTAALSVLTYLESNEPAFRWDAVAGSLATYVGQTTPRKSSLCGTTLKRNSPQLFSRPGRHFHHLNNVTPTIVEALVVPIYLDNFALGTVWIVSHDKRQKFDSADVDIINSLGSFVSSILWTRVQHSCKFPQ